MPFDFGLIGDIANAAAAPCVESGLIGAAVVHHQTADLMNEIGAHPLFKDAAETSEGVMTAGREPASPKSEPRATAFVATAPVNEGPVSRATLKTAKPFHSKPGNPFNFG